MSDKTLGCTLLLLLALGCSDDSLLREGNGINRAIDDELCQCEPDVAECRAEVAADYSSEIARVELACLEQSLGRRSSALSSYIACAVDVTRDFLGCVQRAGCDDAALTACGEAQEAAIDACPPPPETEFEAFLDDADECVERRLAGPPGGACPNETVSGTGLVLSTSTVGQGNDNAPSCGGESSSDVTVAWTAPTSGAFRVTTQGSGFDTVLAAYSGCDGVELDCNDDGDTTTDFASELVLDVSAGTVIVFVIDGFGSEAGDALLTIEPF